MFTLADYRKRKYSKEEPVKHRVHFNSTTQPLDSGESFIGLIEETKDCETIHISLIADTSGNVTLKQSVDGIVFDFAETIAFTANTPINFHHKIKGRFFYIVIENNSGDNQTYLRAYTHIKEAVRSFYLENSSLIVENDNLNNLTFDGDGNLMVNVNNTTSLDVNVTNASLAVTNSALSSLSFSGGRLLTSNPALSSSSDSVLCYGSDDSGTNKRVIKTASDGTVQTTFSNSTIDVTNASLSSLSFSGSRLLTSNSALSSSSDSVLVYGSDDSGTTKRVIKTANDGTVAVSGAVNVSGTVPVSNTVLSGMQLVNSWLSVSDQRQGTILRAYSVNSTGVNFYSGGCYIHHISAFNTSEQTAYLRLYTDVSLVSIQTKRVVAMFVIPPNGSYSESFPVGIYVQSPDGLGFTTGITFRATSRFNSLDVNGADSDLSQLDKSLFVNVLFR